MRCRRARCCARPGTITSNRAPGSAASREWHQVAAARSSPAGSAAPWMHRGACGTPGRSEIVIPRPSSQARRRGTDRGEAGEQHGAWRERRRRPRQRRPVAGIDGLQALTGAVPFARRLAQQIRLRACAPTPAQAPIALQCQRPRQRGRQGARRQQAVRLGQARGDALPDKPGLGRAQQPLATFQRRALRFELAGHPALPGQHVRGSPDTPGAPLRLARHGQTHRGGPLPARHHERGPRVQCGRERSR